MNSLKLFPFLISVALLGGCSSVSKQELLDANSRIHILVSENYELKSELSSVKKENRNLKQELEENDRIRTREVKRTACLALYQAALNSCKTHYHDIQDSLVLQNKLKLCIEAKGYPDGTDSC